MTHAEISTLRILKAAFVDQAQDAARDMNEWAGNEPLRMYCRGQRDAFRNAQCLIQNILDGKDNR